MDLSQRSRAAEAMDDADLDPAIYRRCLRDLAALNRLTRTHRPALKFLARATRNWPAGARLSVLDVGYGQGDLLRLIANWASRRGFDATLSGVDLNPRSAAAARARTPAGLPIAYLTGDIFGYVCQAPPDFIVTSQFTHHLEDARLIDLLRWFEKNAVHGWMITDLHRHGIAYYGFPLLAVALGWHRIVRADGAISIARGFRRAEWQSLLAKAGIGAEISWHLPFRHGVSRLR